MQGHIPEPASGVAVIAPHGPGLVRLPAAAARDGDVQDDAPRDRGDENANTARHRVDLRDRRHRHRAMEDQLLSLPPLESLHPERLPRHATGRRLRAGIAGISDAVPVGVGLRRIGRVRTIVLWIADAVVIGVGPVGVGRTGGARAAARLHHVAGVGRRAAHRPRWQEAVDRAAHVGPVAGLGDVAGAGRCPAGRTRRRDAIRRAEVADAVAALGDVAGTGRRAALAGPLLIGRTGDAGAVTGLDGVADPGRRAAGGPAHREHVRRTVVVHPVAGLGGVARASGGTADRRALHVDRAARSRARALLGDVAGTGRGAAGRAAGDELVDRTGNTHTVAGLGDVTVARDGPTGGAGRRDLVRRAVLVGAVARLRDVAGSGRRAAHRRALHVGGTDVVDSVAGLRRVAHAGAGTALRGALRV